MEVEPEVIDCMNDMLHIVVKKEKQRLYDKKRYEEKRDEILQYQKQYNIENKEKRKQYYNQNKEKILERQNEYDRRPERVKFRRIYDWKRMGVICDNWDALYEHYLKTSYCEFCRCELTYDKISTATTKVLDHDHSITDRPNFRNILCNSCNLKRK